MDAKSTNFVMLESDKDMDILESPMAQFQPPVMKSRVLNWFGITVITYMYVAGGGAFDAETIVVTAGPCAAFILLFAYPLVFLAPYAYIVAELCCAFPEDGGFTIWVRNAFGPFWGFQVGYWSWIGVSISCSFVPPAVLVKLYTYFNVPQLQGATMLICQMLIAITLTIPALLSPRTIARTSAIALVVIFLTILAVTITGYIHFDSFSKLFASRPPPVTPAPSAPAPPNPTDYTAIINTLFWMFDGINLMSVFGGEVHNPARAYPIAIVFTTVMIALTYLLPLPAMPVSSGVQATDFAIRPAYPAVVGKIAGNTVRMVVIIVSMSGSLCQFISGMFAQSFQVCGMAQVELIPRKVSVRSEAFGSPYLGVLATLIGTLIMSCFDSTKLEPVITTFSCAIQVLIMAAAVKLRWKFPFAPRPVNIPGGAGVIVLLAIVPLCVLGYVIVYRLKGDTLLLLIAFFLPGLVGGAIQWYRQRLARL